MTDEVDASLNFRHGGRGNYLPEIDSKSTHKMNYRNCWSTCVYRRGKKRSDTAADIRKESHRKKSTAWTRAYL